MIRHANVRASALAAVLAVLIVLAPLPFGGAYSPFSTWLFSATLALLAVALLLSEPRDGATEIGRRPPIPARSAVPAAALALGGLALLGLLQSLPWPSSFVEIAAPRLVQIGRESARLLGSEPPAFVPLSLAPGASRDAAFDWALPVAAALAAAIAGTSRRSRRILAGGLIAAAGMQVALGIQLWITRSDTLWGLTLPGTRERLRGSFVNPNHAALFFEIALAVTFAWLWWSARRSVLDGDRTESLLLHVGPPSLAFLLTFSAIVLTGSRAGVLAAIAALAVQGFLIGQRRGRTWLLGAGAIAALAGIAFVLLFGVEGSLQRLVATPLDEVGGGGRLRAALATLELWTLSPLTGVGLGAFRASFPLVQPESLPGLWRHAHSDWVELLATTGLIGLALVGTALFLDLRRLRVVIAHGESSEDRAAGIAAAGALVAVGLHSLVDFGLTMPANALALAVVLGAAAAARTRSAPIDPSGE